MAICSVCGGPVTATNPTCPFCGKSNPEFGLADANQDVDWMLLAEDSSPPAAQPAPAAWAPPPAAPPAAPADEWMLLEDDPSPAPQPAPTWEPAPQPAPPWQPAPAAQEALPLAPFELELEPLDAPPAAAPPMAEFAPTYQSEPNVELAPLQFSEPEMTLPTTAPAFGLTLPEAPAALPAGRTCPSCGQSFSPDYTDLFCICGAELPDASAPPAAAALLPVKPPPAAAAPLPVKPPPAPARPPAGTRCLVLYGPDKKPVHYFPITKDVVLVGRLDPVSGCFPDVDVSEWIDEKTARKVSRRHALILHSRAGDTFTLRPLPGNTGTQVNTQLLSGPEDVPLAPGTRVILGGVVRFKFETA